MTPRFWVAVVALVFSIVALAVNSNVMAVVALLLSLAILLGGSDLGDGPRYGRRR